MIALNPHGGTNSKKSPPDSNASLEIDIEEILNEDGGEENEQSQKPLHKGAKIFFYLKRFFVVLIVLGIIYELVVIKYLSLLSLNNPTQQDKDMINTLKPYVSWIFGRPQMSPGTTYDQINSFLGSSSPY